MTNKLKNIFDLLIEVAECNAGYIFSIDNGAPAIVESFGLENFDQTLIEKFNKEFAEKESEIKPEELESFSDISSRNGIKSALITEIQKEPGVSLNLIIFSNSGSLNKAETAGIVKGICKVISPLTLEEEPLSELVNHNFFSRIDVALLITSPNGEKLFANKKLLEMFELDPNSTEKINWDQIKFYDMRNTPIPPEDLPFNLALTKGDNIVDQKLQYKLLDKTKWFKVNAITLKDSHGNIRCIVNSFWDITDAVEIEKNLRETTQNIESVLYSIDAAKNNFNYISESVEKVFGYTPNEIYGKRVTFFRKILPNDLSTFRKFRDKILSGEEAVVEYGVKDKFNNIIYVRHSGVPIIKDGKLKRIVGIISDITEQKKILEALEKSEERFRVLIDTAEDFIFTLKANGHFTLINKNGAHALGNTPKDMIGKDFFDFIDDSCKADVSQAFIDILNSEKPRSFDAVFLDNLGDTIIFEIQARITKLNGEGIGIIGIGRDMTEQRKNQNMLKELNEKLTEANKIISIERDKAKHQIDVLEELNRLKNEFISNVSHELRTPLASIVGFAETISSDKDLPHDMVLEFNNIILNEGKRLAKLINDVLDFSRLESGKEGLNKTHFVLRSVLQEVLSAFSKQAIERKIKLEAFLPAEEVILFADKERIMKALSHLLSNAFKFTKADGTVTIRTFDYPTEVEIRISDTGIGIHENDIPNLFQKFSKVGRPGSQIPGVGFGLVSVKQIIDAHRGHIGVASTVNKGTTFRVRIPKTN